MSKQGEETIQSTSLADHLEAAHRNASDPTTLYHLRAALQHVYCENAADE